MTNTCHEKDAAEIGGYFGLDLPDYGDPFPGMLKFQSGRAALRALLEFSGIRRVMLPAYICDSLIRAVSDAGASVETYFLNDSLYPKKLPNSFDDENCALLYVNYFGLCQENVGRLLQDLPCNRLIIDASQALFALPTHALATIYSPRKFVGVPDGGLLAVSPLEMKVPEDDGRGSLARTKHLLLRAAYMARDGYSEYLEAENALADTRPMGMSRLTKRILTSVDMAMVKRKRRQNYLALADRLDKINRHNWTLDSESVPLCYPLLLDCDVNSFRKELAENGIYIPTYWPEARNRVAGGIESRLIDRCLAIPCDQRYSVNQMEFLADKISNGIEDRPAE